MKKYKLRSYIDLTSEMEKLLEKYFEVLDSRDGAEIVIIPPHKNLDYFLDKKYYPELKVIAINDISDDYIYTRYSTERNIQIITLRDDNTTFSLIDYLIYFTYRG